MAASMANVGEQAYLDLIADILENGEERQGRNGKTLSVFSRRLEFNVLRDGFPLLTTKRVFWRGVVEELLWFLRGSTDARELSDKGIHIWDKNTSREFLDSVGLSDIVEGHIGMGYGHQWRNFGGDLEGDKSTPTTGVDQLHHILYELTHNPHGRRAVLSAWNPQQLHRAALPPCHVLYIFYISKKGLSCQMTQRSGDVCAGVPFNIASTALLTSIIAHVLHIDVHRIILDIADAHIYEQHIENARLQIARVPSAFPMVHITPLINKPLMTKTDDKITWIEKLEFADFELIGYDPHPGLRYEMVA
jgi:thymidylate synthase